MYSRFNIHAYASVYGDKCLGILAQVLPPKGYHEAYTNNICILAKTGDAYLDVGGLPDGKHCLDGTPGSKEAFEDGLLVSNNTVYVPGGAATVQCGKKVSVKQFQGMGYDPLTTVSGDMPSPATIIGWAKALLKPE